eukprot:1995810-Amphidinium_carterae.2
MVIINDSSSLPTSLLPVGGELGGGAASALPDGSAGTKPLTAHYQALRYEGKITYQRLLIINVIGQATLLCRLSELVSRVALLPCFCRSTYLPFSHGLPIEFNLCHMSQQPSPRDWRK